jgi:2-polyprenyl-3-methyl-5-hydroxy-6-metoxy-1,4-benzoquinol methylase
LLEQDVKTFFQADAFERTRCPACGDTTSTDSVEKFDFTYAVCGTCLTMYVTPRPPFRMLSAYYENSPSTKYWIEEFFKPVAEARREKIFKPRVDHVLGTVLRGRKGPLTVGDVGAGFGLFLEEMRKAAPGNTYVAIEPSLDMSRMLRAKGFEIAQMCLEEIEGMEGRFDLMTSFELLDHLHTPELFLRKALALLKPGGILFLTAVNGRGFDILTLWERSNMVAPPIHLTLFNTSSVERLLKAVGFASVDVSTPGRLDWDLVERSIRSEGFDGGRFWNSVAATASEDCKARLQEWIASSGLSSHMWVLARKDSAS